MTRAKERWSVDWELVGTKREVKVVSATCWTHARNIIVRAVRMTFASRAPIIIHGGERV